MGDVLDEVEKARLRPMHVLEHGNERPLLRRSLHEPAHAECDLLGRTVAETEQRGDARILDGVALKLFHDLDGRPVRDPLAVREAPAGDDPRVGTLDEVSGQARFSDARRSEDREERAGSLRPNPVPGVGEQSRLACAADEKRIEAANAAHVSGDGEEPVRGQALGLPFRLERRQALGLDGVAHEPVGGAADEHVAGPGGLLEAGGDVDRVPGHEHVHRYR